MNRFRRMALASALVAASVALAPNAARAESLTRVSGTVRDSAGQPLAGATVALLSPGNVTVQTRSDARGNFLLLGVDYGLAELRVYQSSYIPCVTTFQLASGEDLHVTYRIPKLPATITVLPHLVCQVQTFRSEPFDRYIIR